MKKIGSHTAVWLKQINDPHNPETLYANVTKRVSFNAWETRKKRHSQYDIVSGATSSVNNSTVILRTHLTKKLDGIKSDDTVLWEGQAYTVKDIEEAENTIVLHGLDLLIYLER